MEGEQAAQDALLKAFEPYVEAAVSRNGVGLGVSGQVLGLGGLKPDLCSPAVDVGQATADVARKGEHGEFRAAVRVRHF